PAGSATGSATGSAAQAEGGSRTERGTPISAMFVVDPPAQRGRSFQVVGEVTIGRAVSCDISMPEDSFVSSRHARVWRQGDANWIEDLGSTNGTLLNGQVLKGPSPLRPGDRVQIGKTILEAAR
ncbi:MAG: FHA domain-containing protein, partial [Acidimicrobiales bacterium]